MKQILKPRLHYRRLALCLSVLVAVFANGSIAKSAEDSIESSSQEKTVKAYRLRGNFNIRSEANQESQNFGRLDHSEAEGMKFSAVQGDEKWFKVDLDNGGSGYVNRHALQPTELRGNYILHSDASLESQRVGTVSQIKNPEDLVITGNQKLVDEGGKKIEWVEVMANGKRAWVAGGALTGQTPTHETKRVELTRHTETNPSAVPVPLPRPQAPVAHAIPKVDPRVVQVKLVPPPIRVVKDETRKRDLAPVKPVAPKILPAAKPLLPARPVAKPAVPVLPPVVKPVVARPVPPVRLKPSQEVLPAVDPRLHQAQALPPRVAPPVIPAHPVPPANIPNASPAQPPVVVAPRPIPLKPIECAQTREEYFQNTRLRAAFGPNYNPFVPWHSDCFNSEPTTGGRWIVHICFKGQLFGEPATKIIPVAICYDFSKRIAYTNMDGNRFEFEGRNYDTLHVGHGIKSTDIIREGSGAMVQ